MGRRIAKIAAGLTVLVGVVITGEVGDLWLRTRHFQQADVAGDVERAIGRSDFRLLGTDGAGIELPGVDDATYLTVVRSECFRIIHVGDAFSFDLQRRLYLASRAYAWQYNQRLLARAGQAPMCHAAV